MSETIEDRIEQKRVETEAFRGRLAAAGFDGPHEVHVGGFDPFSAMFGGGPVRYAICLTCGAMVRLDDLDDQGNERSVGLHANWHTEDPA